MSGKETHKPLAAAGKGIDDKHMRRRRAGFRQRSMLGILFDFAQRFRQRQGIAAEFSAFCVGPVFPGPADS